MCTLESQIDSNQVPNLTTLKIVIYNGIHFNLFCAIASNFNVIFL